jgi:hypothetical protein
MGETDSTASTAPAAAAALPYASAPVAPGPINYFRFTPQEAGWTSVASFGTASVWHQARDVLTQKRIVCRMVADPTPSRTEDQRMELLVMASEAEWAREVLRWGIPELVGTAAPPGGFPVMQTAVAPVVPTAPEPAPRPESVPPPLPEWFFRQQTVQPLPVQPVPVQPLPVQPAGPRPVIALSPGDASGLTISYFRYLPPEAGWTRIASFGTANVWHSARDLLSQHRIICRMVADEDAARHGAQRMELLVMAHDAPWAREVLRRGIPELSGGGSERPPLAPRPAGTKAPLAALPVDPVGPAPSPGASAAFIITLVVAFTVLVLLIFFMIWACFIPGP